MTSNSVFGQVARITYENGPLGLVAAILLAVAACSFTALVLLVLNRRKNYLLLLLTVVLIAITGGWLRFSTASYRSYNLASIHLLPGYTLSQGPGDDTYGGSIERPDGFHIGIDIGALSGVWANPFEPGKNFWAYEQTINGHRVFVALRTSGLNGEKKMLCVTFPENMSNFFADVSSEQEIAEMLSMILTYDPRGYHY